MKLIERHTNKDDASAKVAELFLEFSLPHFQNRQAETLEYLVTEFGIERVRNNYLNGFYESCYLSEREWAEKFLYFSNALNRIIVQLSLHENKPVTLHYDEQETTLNGWLVGLRTSTEDKPLSTPEIYNCWYWRDLAHIAFLLRDSALLGQLATITTEETFARIRYYNAINPDGIDRYWHELYCQIMAGDTNQAAEICEDMIQKLEQQPDTHVKNLVHFAATRQRLAMLKLPYLRCVSTYCQNRPEQFAELLYEALKQHKAFCELPFKKTRQGLTIPNSNIPQLFVSVPLLAVCSLAYDQGFRWEVVSDYIPQWLIEQNYKFDLAPMH